MLLSAIDLLLRHPEASHFLTTAALVALAVAFVALFIWRQRLIERKRPSHLRQIGLIRSSNLDDQLDPIYGEANDTTSRPIRIKALYIHPIKSCKPIEVESARLTKVGLAYDRCFALATSKDGDQWEFISQRTKPKMSLVQQELWLPNVNANKNNPLVSAGGCLVVSFPDPSLPTVWSRLQAFLETLRWNAQPRITFRVPLAPETSHAYDTGFAMLDFKIHSRIAQGLDYGRISEVGAIIPKLKQFLDIPARQEFKLLRCTDETLVRTTRNLAPLKHIGTPAMIGYADQQPIHIVTLSSVQALASLLPLENRPLDARRFRANIYLTGPPAYEEETWKRYKLGPGSAHHGRPRSSVNLSVVCRTSRCTMPNVIPEKGTFEEEKPKDGRKRGKAQPSTTLVEHRTVEKGNPAALGYMGMHCVPEDASLNEAAASSGEVWVHVGDEIEVLETGHHLYGSTAHDY